MIESRFFHHDPVEYDFEYEYEYEYQCTKYEHRVSTVALSTSTVALTNKRFLHRNSIADRSLLGLSRVRLGRTQFELMPPAEQQETDQQAHGGRRQD